MELNDETARLIRAYEERCNTLTERCAAAEKEAGHQRNRADGFEGDIRFITKAYFDAGLGSTPTTPDKVAERLREIPTLIGKVEALTKEAEFQRTRANGLEGVEKLRHAAEVARHDAEADRDRARATIERLQDALAKTQKEHEALAMFAAEMSGGRVTNYDFTHRGKGEDHVQQLLAVIREGHEQDMAERRARLEQATEAAPFLGVLARVHEVFDNLQPGRAGRLGGAWRLYEAGWRADQTVEEAHRLLKQRTGERMVHPDPVVCALIEATKSQWTGPDAVKALAPLALATNPAPDEALVANLESALADRDSYHEALLAAGMNADEPEPIKWAKEHAQEVSDNEAIVRMLGITAWEAGPAMEPDPVATLVELFQFSMPPEFTLRCEDEAEDGTKFAARWTWTNDGEASSSDFATPLLALEDAWMRHSALGEAKARKEAAHVADTIERVAKEHGVEFDRTSDASVTRSVVALGEKLKGHATDSARSAVLEDALRTAGMPPHCSNPVRWADVHVDGWKTMRSALGRLVQVREVDGATIRNLADLEHVCDKYSEETRGPVLVCASHPELGEMVTLTIPQGYIRTPQGRLAATVDSLIGDTWDLQAMGGTRADAVQLWEKFANRWCQICLWLHITPSENPPARIRAERAEYETIRAIFADKDTGALPEGSGSLVDIVRDLNRRGRQAHTDKAVHTTASIAERFPEASRIVVVDPSRRVFGGAQDDKRVLIVNSDIGHSEAQDRADVVVVVRSDGTLFVRKNRHGLVGEIIERGPVSHPRAYMGVDLAKDGASDSTVTVRHLASAGSNMAYCGAPNDPHSVDSPSQMDCPACSAMLARDCSSVEGPVPAKAPGWTGITWTSRKGKAKSVSIPGMVLASGIVEGTSGPFTAVNIPDGVARLPMNLLRRVRSGGLLTFHMGDLKRTGTIAWQSGVDRAIRFDRLRIEIAES